MSHKRPLNPVPIFNQGKRPRQALVAHPNNHGGVSHEATTTQHYKMTANINKENRDPCFFSKPQEDTHTQRKGKFTPYQYQQGLGRKAQLISHNSAENWKHKPVAQDYRRSSTGPSTPHQYKGFTAHDQTPTVPAVGNAIIKAREPSETASLEISHAVNQSTRQKNRELRVLTATAQGVEHWSKYTPYAQLLFEVYGTMLAAPSSHGNHAKRFTLKTADGTIGCVFWEMEHKFPDFIRQGQEVRVVGEWRDSAKAFQCYSVRAVQKEEDGLAEQCVKAADSHMRKVAATARL